RLKDRMSSGGRSTPSPPGGDSPRSRSPKVRPSMALAPRLKDRRSSGGRSTPSPPGGDSCRSREHTNASGVIRLSCGSEAQRRSVDAELRAAAAGHPDPAAVPAPVAALHAARARELADQFGAYADRHVAIAFAAVAGFAAHDPAAAVVRAPVSGT